MTTPRCVSWTRVDPCVVRSKPQSCGRAAWQEFGDLSLGGTFCYPWRRQTVKREMHEPLGTFIMGHVAGTKIPCLMSFLHENAVSHQIWFCSSCTSKVSTCFAVGESIVGQGSGTLQLESSTGKGTGRRRSWMQARPKDAQRITLRVNFGSVIGFSPLLVWKWMQSRKDAKPAWWKPSPADS